MRDLDGIKANNTELFCKEWIIVSNIAKRLIVMKIRHEDHCWPRCIGGVLGRGSKLEGYKKQIFGFKVGL